MASERVINDAHILDGVTHANLYQSCEAEMEAVATAWNKKAFELTPRWIVAAVKHKANMQFHNYGYQADRRKEVAMLKEIAAEKGIDLEAELARRLENCTGTEGDEAQE